MEKLHERRPLLRPLAPHAGSIRDAFPPPEQIPAFIAALALLAIPSPWKCCGLTFVWRIFA